MNCLDTLQEFVEKDIAERKQRYAVFLQSPQWRAASARVRERFHNLCLFCRCSENLEVHHLSYLLPNRSDAPPGIPSGWLPIADAGLIRKSPS